MAKIPIEKQLIDTKESLFKIKKDFNLCISGQKWTFSYKNGKKEEKLIFTNYDENAFLHIVKKISDDMKKAYNEQILKPELNDFFWSLCSADFYTPHKKPQIIEKREIHYQGFSDNLTILNNTELLEIDINGAYVKAAHLLGYISGINYFLIRDIRNALQDKINKGIDIDKNKELIKQLKYASLMGIGAAGKVIRFEEYKHTGNGNYKTRYHNETMCSHIIMKHIHHYLGEVMKEALNICGFFFWVDAIFVKKEDRDKMVNFFNEKGFDTKEEVFFVTFAGDRIVKENEKTKKEYFLTSQYKEKINNYFD